MKNYLDLYSVPVNFTYHNYYLYPSYWGGIFSLILECLLVAYLVFLLYDMSEREFPELAIHTRYDYDPDQIEIVSDNSLQDPSDIPSSEEDHKSYWYTAIGIKRNFNLIPISEFEKHFTVSVKQMYGRNGFVDGKTLSIEQCKKFGNGFVTEESFESLGLENGICITDNYFLEGIYNTPNSKWLEITIKKNFEASDSDKPTSADGYQFEFYYQSRSLNTTKFTKDLTVSVMEEVFWDYLENNTKISQLKLSMDKVLTNDYFLPRFIVRKYKKSYALTTKSWNEQTKGIEDKAVLILRISLDTIQLTTERAFHDILTQLAMIGGLAGVVFPVGFLFVYSIRNFRMTENMMNDCYFIIDPTNKDSIQSFDEFLKKHYNKLIGLYKDKINRKSAFRSSSKKEEKIELNNYVVSEEDNNDEAAQSKQAMLAKYLSERELNDDEGINQKDLNPVERFFTLKRIEDLFGLTREDRESVMKSKDPSSIFDFSKVKETKYVCYTIIFNSTVYKSQPDFTFSFCEMFSYFFFVMCCCKRKKEVFNLHNTKKVNLIENDYKGEGFSSKKSSRSINFDKEQETEKTQPLTSSEKKYAVYRGATKKLGVDFDLVNILKTIEGFDYFTKVFFEKNQRALFYSVSKPTIKEEDNNKEGNQVKESDNKEVQEYQDIQDMYKNLLRMIFHSKGKLEDYQIRLLELMGRTPEEIQMLNNIVIGKPMNYVEHSGVSEKKRKDANKISNEGETDNNDSQKEGENSNILIENALEEFFWNKPK